MAAILQDYLTCYNEGGGRTKKKVGKDDLISNWLGKEKPRKEHLTSSKGEKEKGASRGNGEKPSSLYINQPEKEMSPDLTVATSIIALFA